MFSAYVDFLEHWYDISDESLYNGIVDDYFSLAHDCDEGVIDFILNTKMKGNTNG